MKKRNPRLIYYNISPLSTRRVAAVLAPLRQSVNPVACRRHVRSAHPVFHATLNRKHICPRVRRSCTSKLCLAWASLLFSATRELYSIY